MALRIEDYAIIGDTRSVALVGLDGSIDWLCLPRFDSAAFFAALLGDADNSSWRLAPVGTVTARRRRYQGDTLILETEFSTNEGTVSVIDFMPVPESDDRPAKVIRLAMGRAGSVPMQTEIASRFDYGRITPWLSARGGGWRAIAGPDAVRIQTPVTLHQEQQRLIGKFTIAAGQVVPFALNWYPSHHTAPTMDDPQGLLQATEHWWENWSSRCIYEGPWRDAVMRSLITLKALTYRPTGAITAAATTSLPEAIGGGRNWDYRFCWLRDATFTLYALLLNGYREEALAWRAWLERAVAGDPADMQIMYGIAGERRLWEFELPWLAGYEGSRPVRVGNEAHTQFQLDIYGEVMDTLHVSRSKHIPPDPEAWYIQRAMLDFVAANWDRPDDGLWEMRGPRRHFTHSKVMAWVAVDRAVKAVEHFGLEGPVAHWRTLRDRIHADVCARGFDPARNSFVQYYGGQELDAALLMIPLVGFLPAHDPRVSGTVEAIRRELMHNDLVNRYDTASAVDGLAGGEGAFLACSFWLTDNLTLLGRWDEAEQLFEHLLSLRNDVGLLAEEYDTGMGRQLGNFPQAFSHVALINTAHNLSRKPGPASQRSTPHA